MKHIIFFLFASMGLCTEAGAADLLSTMDKISANLPAIIMFLIFVLITMGITYWAANRTKSTNAFYTGGSSFSGLQNGLAIGGDYMSAAGLLGISSMVYAKGFDGLVYILCYFAAWPIFLFMMSERLRNLGRYTFADITSFRLNESKIRLMSAICSLTVVCFYLIVQMVGAGGLIELLFGLDYWIAVVVVGVLMTVYVSFGGMIATTWVQIIKAALLGIGGVGLALLSLSHADFSFEVMAAKAVAVYSNGIKLMAPGNFLTDPVTVISLSVGLVFGTMGLPHILMRFFTVANSKEARKSVFYATIFIGLFFLASALIGLGAIIGVGTDSQFFEGGRIGGKIIGGNNMIALHLAKALGGHLLLGFLSAVTFATIIAVVAGLGLAGAANISHDIYARVIKKGQVTSAQELKVSRFATIIIGVVGIILGIMFKDLNLTFLVGLAFGIAASANFPVLFLAMFWSGLTTRGALFGGLTGLVSAVLMVVLSKSVWVIVLGNAHPIFPYEQPALFSMPLAFIVAYLASKFDHSEEAEKERAAFFDQEVRAQTGVGAAGASMH